MPITRLSQVLTTRLSQAQITRLTCLSVLQDFFGLARYVVNFV